MEINNATEWDGEIFVARTYPFRLPWTPGNAHKWRHADRLDALGEILSLKCDLYVNGDLELSGRVYLLQTVEGKSFSVQVTQDKDLIDTAKQLKDYDYGGLYGTYSGEAFTWTDQPDDVKDAKYPEVALALPMVRQLNFNYDHFNLYDITTQQYVGVMNAVVPMFYLGWVLEKIAASMKLRFTGCFSTDEELQKVIIFNMHHLYIFGGTQSPLDPKNHVPNITFKELLRSIRIRFGLGVHLDLVKNELYLFSCRDMLRNIKEVDITNLISGKQPQDIRPKAEEVNFKQTFDTADGMIRFYKPEEEVKSKGTVATVFDLFFTITSPQIGDVYLVEEENFYYRRTASTWVQWMYRYFDSNARLQEGITDSSSSLITTENFDSYNGVVVKTPHAEYERAKFEVNDLDPSLRFLIYHGLQPAKSTALDYPFASIDHTNADGDVIGSMELREDGEYGLVNRYKKYRSQLRGAVRFPAVYLSPAAGGKVQQLKPDVMVRIRGNLFAWTEKTRVYNMRGLQTVELKLARI